MGKKSAKKPTEPKTDNAEKKTRNRKPILETMLKSFQNASKMIASLDAKEKAARAKLDKIDDRLNKWGKLDQIVEANVTIEALILEGFVPPKATRAVKSPDFAEGATVRIKDEFASKYSPVYSEVELHSMTYDFFDEVNKVAMCSTSERMIVAKLKHLEAR